LPVILVAVLGFQVYEYIQMNRQRLATQHVSDARPAVPKPRTPPPGHTAPPETADPDAEPMEAGEPQAAQPDADESDAAQPDAGGPDAAEPGGAQPESGEPGAAQPQDAGPSSAGAAPGEQAPDATPTRDGDKPAAPPSEAAADAASAGLVGANVKAMEAVDAMAPEQAGHPQEAAEPKEAGVEAPAAELEAPPLATRAPQRSAPPGARRRRPAAQPREQQLPAAGNAELTVVPRTNPAKVGEVIAVDVVLRGGSEVNGVIFHLRFDPAVLQLNESPQSELGDFFAAAADTTLNARPLNGKVVVSITRPPGQEGLSGDGTLATFHFQVLAAEQTRIDLLQTAVRDVRNRPQSAVASNATLLVVD
jgi:hypothetical protein